MHNGPTFQTYTLRKNQILYHIYKHNYGPLSFNASGAGNRRFDPITDSKAVTIPSYYAAFSDLVAIVETIISKNTLGLANFTWRPPVIDSSQARLCMAQFSINRSLTLLDMETLYIDTAIDVPALLKMDGRGYEQLQTISAYITQNYPDIDGLIWHSYQKGIPGERSLIFYGDRVTTSDLVLSSWDDLDSNFLMERLRDAALAANTVVPSWLIKY